jgi:hypothetical protein
MTEGGKAKVKVKSKKAKVKKGNVWMFYSQVQPMVFSLVYEAFPQGQIATCLEIARMDF